MNNSALTKKSHKLIAIILCIGMMFLFSFPGFSLAADSDFVINGSGVITGYNGSGGDIVVPDSINGIEVTSIGNDAFYGKTSIHSVEIEGLTKIGDRAFQNCSNLESVIIKNVGNIANDAFYQCSGLKYVTIEDVSTIGQRAFQGCSNLDTVNMEDVSNIGIDAFTGTGIKNLTIEGSGTSIGQRAFNACTRLKSVTMVNVTSIANEAFYGCSNLKSVSIQGNETSIGARAFQGCSKLQSVEMEKVSSIAVEAFYGIASLKDLHIGSVKTIDSRAFNGCTSLTSVALPNVSGIGDEAFYGCSSLLNAYFTNNAPSVGNRIFDGSKSDFFVYYLEGTAGFTTPTWHGYQTMMIPDAANQEQVAPEGLVGVAPTTAANDNGKITGVTSDLEYRFDTETTYTAVSETEITGLVPGTYFVRYAAKTGYNAGEDAAVVIPEYMAVNQDQPAPEGLSVVAPTSVAGNDGQILGVTTAMEYKLETSAEYTAVTGTSITGLAPGIYYVRYAAAEGYNVGDDAGVVVPEYSVVNQDQAAPTLLTWIAPTSPANNDGQITGVTSAMEYRLSTATDYTVVTGTAITGLVPGTYFVRYAAAEGFNAGAEATVVIPEYMPVNQEQAAPAGIVGVAPTTAENQDGQITGVTTAMEYRLSTATDYISVTETSITGLAAGTYYVRYAATLGFDAGADAVVVIPAYAFVVPELSKYANNIPHGKDGDLNTYANIFHEEGYIIYGLSDLGLQDSDEGRYVISASDRSAQTIELEYLDSEFQIISASTLDVSGYKNAYTDRIPNGAVYVKIKGKTDAQINIYEMRTNEGITAELYKNASNLTHAYDGKINTYANIFSNDGYIVYPLSVLDLDGKNRIEFTIKFTNDDGSFGDGNESVLLQYLDADFNVIDTDTLDISGVAGSYAAQIADGSVYVKISGIAGIVNIHEIGRVSVNASPSLWRNANNQTHAYDEIDTSYANIFTPGGYIVYKLSDLGLDDVEMLKYCLKYMNYDITLGTSSKSVLIECLDENLDVVASRTLDITGDKNSYVVKKPSDGMYVRINGTSGIVNIHEIEDLASNPDLWQSANNIDHAYDGNLDTYSNIFGSNGYIIYKLSVLGLAGGDEAVYTLNASDGSSQTVELEYLDEELNEVSTGSLDIAGYDQDYTDDIPGDAEYVRINGISGPYLSIREIRE